MSKTKQRPSGYWTLARLQADAAQYPTKKAWRKGSQSAYVTAQRHKVTDKCTKHMEDTIKPRGYWTLEQCKKDALMHDTRTAWQRCGTSGYTIARQHNWLNECCQHMERKQFQRGFWTVEECIMEAQKFNTVQEWFRNSPSGYPAAIRHGEECVLECTKHMS